MEVWLSDRFRLFAVLSLCTALWSVESVVPLFQYREGRLRRAFPNLFFASVLVGTNFALASAVAMSSAYAARNGLGLLFWSRTSPPLLAVLGIAGLDFSTYLAHVLLHKIPAGWRFHRVHHSENEVDVTTTFRQHPGETLWRMSWQILATIVLGLPLWVVSIYLTLSALNGLLEHANITVNSSLERWLGLLLVTPSMHKIHHSRVQLQTDTNYSNIFSLWDRLFHTYTSPAPAASGLRYGLDGFDAPEHQTVAALLRAPFRDS